MQIFRGSGVPWSNNNAVYLAEWEESGIFVE